MTFSLQHKNTSHLFIQSTALFLLIAKILSWKLWLANRTLPTVPIFDFLYAVPNFIHLILLLTSIFCLVVFIVKPTVNKALAIFLLVEVASCLLDQNRWQPWEYQYVFMFFILWVNRKNEQAALLLLLIVFSSTYFYSGLQKFNPHFLKIVWKRTILEAFLHLPNNITQQAITIRLGYIVPATEIALGICLLIRRTRKIAMAFLIVMHLVVLIIIGPWGINYNLIVWPWNLAMAVFFVIIWNKEIDMAQVKLLLKPNINWITIIAWVCLPLLNFIGYWDYFFSSSLYAGRIDMCNIEITKPPQNFELNKYYKPKENSDTSNIETIVVQTWAMGEFNTPSCPQARVYKKIKQQWIKKYPAVKAKFLLIDRSKNKTVISELQ